MENRVKEWMVQYIASVLSINAEDIDENETFDVLGLDSVEAVIMAGLMEEEFRTSIDPIELYENPSIAAFARHFAARDRQSAETSPAQ